MIIRKSKTLLDLLYKSYVLDFRMISWLLIVITTVRTKTASPS